MDNLTKRQFEQEAQGQHFSTKRAKELNKLFFFMRILIRTKSCSAGKKKLKMELQMKHSQELSFASAIKLWLNTRLFYNFELYFQKYVVCFVWSVLVCL